MFDPFGNRLHRPLKRASLDYHNAKYHGNVEQQEPRGLGLLLDHHYMLAISRWEHTKACGATTVLFPDGTLFQGQLQDSLPEGLCTYFTKTGLVIYAIFSREGDILVAINSIQDSSIHFVKINRAVFQILMRETDENRLLTEYRKEQGQGVFMADQKKYFSEGSKIDLLQNYFRREVREQNTSYRTFIVEHFAKGQDKEEVLEVTESKEELGFGFKGSSIVCKITGGRPLTVKTLGHFNHISNSFEICRKDNNSGNLEETIGDIVCEYPKMPQQRPVQCLSLIHQYYKQSLDFHNKNFNLDYFYRVKFIFQAVQQLFSGISTTYLAQQLLENPKEMQMTRTTANIEPKREEFSFYAIEQVRENVLEALRRKSLGYSRSISKSEKKKEREWRSPNDTYVHNRHIDHTPSHPYPFKYIYPHLLQTSSAHKLSKSNQKITVPATSSSNNKLNYSTFEATPLFERSRRRSPLSKYAYLQEKSEKVNHKRTQNMKVLTRYYEDVQRDTQGEHTFYQTPVKKVSFKQKSIGSQGTKESNLSGSKGPKRRLVYGWD